jgi:hypothetical protein
MLRHDDLNLGILSIYAGLGLINHDQAADMTACRLKQTSVRQKSG